MLRFYSFRIWVAFVMYFYSDGNVSCTYEIGKICFKLPGISFSDLEREGYGYT